MKFTINGTEYEGAKYDYNTHCELQELGVEVLEIKKKPHAIARAYLAISSGMDLETAGKEIEQHVINGGNLNDIIVALLKEMDQSDFFRAIISRVTDQKKEPEKKTRKSTK